MLNKIVRALSHIHYILELEKNLILMGTLDARSFKSSVEGDVSVGKDKDCDNKKKVKSLYILKRFELA